MAHYLNQAIMREFHALKASCASRYPVKMLYDNSRKDFDSSCFEDQSDFFLYDWKQVGRNYRLLKSGLKSVVPGNCIFPVLLFAKGIPAFNYLWRVEYDARYTGDWSRLFRHFSRNRSDLLATTIFRYNFRPGWNWWKSLKSPRAPLKKSSLIRGFLPIFRLSRNACTLLDRSYREGWTGHYEVAIPTILSHHGCSIEDIGGDGEFVNSKNKNRFYTNTPSAPGLAPGTFVCPPYSCGSLDIPNMLYHPVKE